MDVPEVIRDLARDIDELLLQVEACLQQNWGEWKGIGEWVVKTLSHGYILPFIGDPSLSTSPVQLVAYKTRMEQHIALGLAVAEMVKKGAVKHLEDSQVAFYV